MVVCLVGGIVGFIALGSARRASVQGLDVTQEALTSLRSTWSWPTTSSARCRRACWWWRTPSGRWPRRSTTADDVLAEVQDLASALPGSVDAARSTLRSLGSVAAVIDQTLAAASQIPFVPDYTPPRPLAEVVGQLDADLAPIQEALTGLDQNLQGLTEASGGLSPGLDQLCRGWATSTGSWPAPTSSSSSTWPPPTGPPSWSPMPRNDLDRDLTALRWLMLPGWPGAGPDPARPHLVGRGPAGQVARSSHRSGAQPRSSECEPAGRRTLTGRRRRWQPGWR